MAKKTAAPSAARRAEWAEWRRLIDEYWEALERVPSGELPPESPVELTTGQIWRLVVEIERLEKLLAKRRER